MSVFLLEESPVNWHEVTVIGDVSAFYIHIYLPGSSIIILKSRTH